MHNKLKPCTTHTTEHHTHLAGGFETQPHVTNVSQATLLLLNSQTFLPIKEYGRLFLEGSLTLELGVLLMPDRIAKVFLADIVDIV